jgi:CubicO group peptidase (beta-lactamase class C family)
LVLEAIVHQPLSTILQTQVLVPLGVHNTGFALDDVHNLATPYVATSARADKKNVLGAALNCFMERDAGVAITSAATLTPGGRVLKAGDAGLYSTPADWAKLMSCLQQGKGLLKQETFEFFFMQPPHQTLTMWVATTTTFQTKGL